MHATDFQFGRQHAHRKISAQAGSGLLALLLAATLLLPPWLLPRAAVLLPLAPVQNPQEEESHSSHSVAAQLQLSSISGSRVRSPFTRLARGPAQPRLTAALGCSSQCALPKAELAGRNGCGAPLRC